METQDGPHILLHIFLEFSLSLKIGLVEFMHFLNLEVAAVVQLAEGPVVSRTESGWRSPKNCHLPVKIIIVCKFIEQNTYIYK